MFFRDALYFVLTNLKMYRNHSYTRSGKASPKANYGKHVHIGYHSVVTDGCDIGDYSYVNSNSSVEETTIGKYCSISSGVWINPSEHKVNKFLTGPLFGSGGVHEDRVVIGNNVLISLNVIILSGVHIGDGAVIGAGAIVTKDVPPYSVVVGNPAHVIKYRFSEDDIEELKNKYGDFYNNLNALNEINKFM